MHTKQTIVEGSKVNRCGRKGKALYVSKVVDREGTIVRWDDGKVGYATTSALRLAAC